MIFAGVLLYRVNIKSNPTATFVDISAASGCERIFFTKFYTTVEQ